MQIRFQKLDDKGQVVPNEWVWYDTDKVDNQDMRNAIDVAIQKQNIVAINIEALSFFRTHLENGIKQELVQANAEVEPQEEVVVEEETKKAK
jgi:hypothetical protein